LTETARNSWGFSLFCDDIRQELGGKLSVMGIYQADMIFPATQTFPTVVPRFAILVKYYEIKDAFSDDITIRLFLPGDARESPSITMPISRAGLLSGLPEHPLEDDQERVFNLTYPVMMQPLVIKQEGFVKVRVACGTIITNLGSLMVRKAQPDENIQFPGFNPLPPPPPSA
jgi:hypothetical protein